MQNYDIYKIDGRSSGMKKLGRFSASSAKSALSKYLSTGKNSKKESRKRTQPNRGLSGKYFVIPVPVKQKYEYKVKMN